MSLLPLNCKLKRNNLSIPTHIVPLISIYYHFTNLEIFYIKLFFQLINIKETKVLTDLKKDLAIGSLFITGIYGFISGAFIVSTVLFGTAAMLSNIFLREKIS